MVKDVGRRAAHAIVEAFDRVGMNETAGVFPVLVASNGVRHEGLADRHERYPVVVLQVRRFVSGVAR